MSQDESYQEEGALTWEALLNDLKDWQEKHLSPFCLNECQIVCCDLSRFKLPLTLEELICILGQTPEDLSQYRTETEGKYQYTLGFCPQYNDTTRECKVINDPKRPKGCEIFPFILFTKSRPNLDQASEKWIAIKASCPLANMGPDFLGLRQIAERYGFDLFVFNPKPD